MHTKDNHEVKVGDKLWMQFEVTGCTGGTEYCNCDVQSCEVMFPGQNKNSMVINTKQAYKNPPLVAEFNFGDLVGYGQKAINVLKVAGDAGIDLVRQSMVMYKAVTSKDLIGIFTALDNGKRDVTAIMEAIKAEFDITDG